MTSQFNTRSITRGGYFFYYRRPPRWRHPGLMAALPRCLTTAKSDFLKEHSPSVEGTPLPTRAQLRAVRMQAALPMIGFGFMDQTIMIHAGNAIDCTIGVSLGISTLAAAAVGQIVANAGGILFGQTLERFFSRFLWVPRTNLSSEQLSLVVVERARFSGTFWGIIAGCLLGLINLLCIDTHWSHEQKLNNTLWNQSSFEIQISNKHSLSTKHQPATTLTIRGPDMDGILATLLAALKEEGFSVLEMSAKPADEEEGKASVYEDVFVLRRRGEAIPEAELSKLTQRILSKLINENKEKPEESSNSDEEELPLSLLD